MSRQQRNCVLNLFLQALVHVLINVIPHQVLEFVSVIHKSRLSHFAPRPVCEFEQVSP
jgi:hypothetical protein